MAKCHSKAGIVANGIFKKRDKTFTQKVKREVSLMKMSPLLSEKEHLSSDFSTHEIKAAWVLLKRGKAAGPNGIHNEFLTHLGPKLPKWVTCFYNVCFNTNHIPKLWRRASLLQYLSREKM